MMPSKKFTVPVGLATAVLPGAFTLTAAVRVTDWPDIEGLTALLSKVVVSALLTTWVTAEEVEGLGMASWREGAEMLGVVVLRELELKVAGVTPPLAGGLL